MCPADIFDWLFEHGACKCTPAELNKFMLEHYQVDVSGLLTIIKNATPVKYVVKYKRIAPKVLSVWIEEK